MLYQLSGNLYMLGCFDEGEELFCCNRQISQKVQKGNSNETPSLPEDLRRAPENSNGVQTYMVLAF
jgi:hypothetical protein